MKICLVSDSFDHRRLLASTVTEAEDLGAQVVLHCGDLVAPSTLHAISKLGLPIHWNNAGDLYHLSRITRESLVCGLDLLTLAGITYRAR